MEKVVNSRCPNKTCPILIDGDAPEILREDCEDIITAYKKVLRCGDYAIIKGHRIAFLKTRNPLFAWRAIEYCLTPFSERHRWLIKIMTKVYERASDVCETDESEIAEWNHISEGISQFSADRSVLLLPDWCQDYLSFAAKNLLKMSSNNKGSIDSKSAIKKLARNLGFVRLGWNAFSNYLSVSKSKVYSSRLRIMTEGGMSKADARKRLLDLYGLTDERSLIRRLAQGQELSDG